MPDDPTGYADALASVEPGSLSERGQRIAIGMAMIREGSSCLAASKAVGVPNSTLWGYARKITELGNETAEGMTTAIESLQRGAVVASALATERVTERLANPDHDWKDGDLIKAAGVFADKAVLLRTGDSGSGPNALAGLLQLVQGANVTLTKRDESDEATPVEAERID